MDAQRPRAVKAILNNKNTVGGDIWFQIIVQSCSNKKKIARYWHRNRCIDQLNRIPGCKSTQLQYLILSTKMPEVYIGEKKASSIIGAEKTECQHVEKGSRP